MGMRGSLCKLLSRAGRGPGAISSQMFPTKHACATECKNSHWMSAWIVPCRPLLQYTEYHWAGSGQERFGQAALTGVNAQSCGAHACLCLRAVCIDQLKPVMNLLVACTGMS